jgi:hypothetical protein
MPDIVGSLMRPVAGAACLILALASRAVAQQPLPDPAPTQGFLTRYDFQVMLASLAYDDARFSWDGRASADLDLVDYLVGRFSVLGEYQVVMGSELRPFDANQGNYVLEVSSSLRGGANEFAAVFQHESRHLSDRAKRRAVAMNLLGARVLRRVPLRVGTLDVWADLGRVVRYAYVDYTWRGRVNLVARRGISPRLALFGRAFGEIYGVDPQIAGREGQYGGRLEGGVRLWGQAAALELFAGYERVVDADPLDRQPRQWAFAGFRVVN